jgi:hypothetical protein
MTTSFGTRPQRAPAFAWSYSKLKNYRSCPFRHYNYDIAKLVREPPSAALERGYEIHDALAKRIAKGKTLPAEIAEYEEWVQKFLHNADKPGVRVLVEQKWAIDRDLNPLPDFFDRRTWFRAIADAVKIDGPVALNWDWKTGKPKEDATQIVTAAACLMVHYPEVQVVLNEFIWLEYDQKSTVVVRRTDLPKLWADLLPEVNAYEQACANSQFPPKKNGLCREWCAVENCIHHPEYVAK